MLSALRRRSGEQWPLRDEGKRRTVLEEEELYKINESRG